MLKRVMCVWFPHWPIQRRLADAPAERSRPLIVHSAISQGKTRVLACSRLAWERGVRPGMLLVEAQSLWPVNASVRCEPDDPHADRQALKELAQWCQRFSPTVAIDQVESPDSLLLDATGFPDEEALAKDVAVSLQRHGYRAVAVIADNIGTAWAIAHYGRLNSTVAHLVVPCRETKNALRVLPIEALRLSDNIVQVLHELNVFRIEQLLVLPRSELPSRFGAEILLHIDRALGTVPEVAKPEKLVEPLEACWEFEPPLADARMLVKVIDHLLERLLGQIHREHLGIQRLLCTLKLAGHEPLVFPIELLRPSSSQQDLVELARLQIERLLIPTEVLQVTVRVAVILPLEFRQDEMFGGSEELQEGNEIAGLLERLSSRLGENAVLRPHLWPDAQPEFACRYEPAMACRFAYSARNDKRDAPRPAFLKSRPQPILVGLNVSDESLREFHWNQQHCPIERSWGPERIETGWWRGDDVRRDYFVVETAAGERFWVFQNLFDGSWYLHGGFG